MGTLCSFAPVAMKGLIKFSVLSLYSYIPNIPDVYSQRYFSASLKNSAFFLYLCSCFVSFSVLQQMHDITIVKYETIKRTVFFDLIVPNSVVGEILYWYRFESTVMTILILLWFTLILLCIHVYYVCVMLC